MLRAPSPREAPAGGRLLPTESAATAPTEAGWCPGDQAALDPKGPRLTRTDIPTEEREGTQGRAGGEQRAVRSRAAPGPAGTLRSRLLRVPGGGGPQRDVSGCGDSGSQAQTQEAQPAGSFEEG